MNIATAMNAHGRRGAAIVVLLMMVGAFGIGTAAAVTVDGVATGWAIGALPTPVLAPNGHLSAVSCVSALVCSAVGYSHDEGGVDISLAERWDGARWTIQPTPNPAGANNTFLTGVSCTSATACVAVGDFVDSAGRQLPLAQRWNGQRWDAQRLPNPAGAAETFLTGVSCTSSTVCVAVGYARQGGTATTVAERWEGGTWRLESTPNVAGINASRLSSVSCASASACTAVGFSGDMFADPQAVAEHWNGTGWAIQPVAQPPGGTKSVLSSVSCATSSRCVAAGYWRDGGKGGGTLAEHWDGSDWAVEPTPGGRTDVYTSVSCTADDACLVVGKSDLSDFVAARWDGASWTSTTAPASGTLIDTNYVGLSCGGTVDACVAVGASETAEYDFTYLTLAANWNGNSWTAQPTPNPSGATANELVAVSCATERSCVAVGFTWRTADAAEPLVEQWNGRNWVIDATPLVNTGSLSAVSCAADDDCLAVGSDVDAAGALAPLAEHWNGRSWQVQTTPTPAGSSAAGFSSVSCIRTGADHRTADSTDGQVHPTACTAVGAYADPTGAAAMLAERSTGTTWTSQTVNAPTGTNSAGLTAVSCVGPSDCTAVGAYATGTAGPFGPPGPCDFSCTLSEEWNGTTWQTQLPPAPPTSINQSLSSVSCIAAAACIAAGQWTPQERAGGHPGITLAESWNGSNWTVQPTPDPTGVGGPDGTNNSPFEAVSCSQPPRGCTAVGNYDSGNNGSGNSDDAFLPLAEHLNGTGWTVQTIPAPVGSSYNDLRGVSCPTTRMCVAVGMSYRNNNANNSSGPHVSLAEIYQRS